VAPESYDLAVSTYAARRSAASQRLLALATIAIVATLLLAGALAWFRVASALSDAKPVQVPEIRAVTAITWSNRVFDSRQGFARFLRSQGLSYDTWASHHPGPAKLLATGR
jgi:hypothetical protein